MPDKPWAIWFAVPLFLFLSVTSGHAGGPQDYTSIKKQAETYFEEGSYSRAHALYKEARNGNVPASEKQWVAFRLADTLVAAGSGNQQSGQHKNRAGQNTTGKYGARYQA